MYEADKCPNVTGIKYVPLLIIVSAVKPRNERIIQETCSSENMPV